MMMGRKGRVSPVAAMVVAVVAIVWGQWNADRHLMSVRWTNGSIAFGVVAAIVAVIALLVSVRSRWRSEPRLAIRMLKMMALIVQLLVILLIGLIGLVRLDTRSHGTDSAASALPPAPADPLLDSFLKSCARGVNTWRAGTVDYPRDIHVPLGESRVYIAAVDVRTVALPPAEVVPGIPQLGQAAFSVQCTLSARLTASGDSLQLDSSGWIAKQFTPAGFLDWAWNVKALKPKDQELRLDLQPTVSITQLQYGAQPEDSYEHTMTSTTFVTAAHVDASWIELAGQWWKDNWSIVLTILGGLGTAILAVVKWGGTAGEAIKEALAKWRGDSLGRRSSVTEQTKK